LSSNSDSIQWYKINVSSGTPVLADQGDVGGGANVYDTYPAIDINGLGDIGMVFMQSGTAAGQFLSVYATGRNLSDPAGTMETPALVQAGQDNYSDFIPFLNPPGAQRAGGINQDANGSFWAVSEYANNEHNTDPQGRTNWGTAITNFSVGVMLSGEAFVDTNGNQILDPGEPGFPNITVELLDSSGLPGLRCSLPGALAQGHSRFRCCGGLLIGWSCEFSPLMTAIG
jgi:hypothetical protein